MRISRGLIVASMAVAFVGAAFLAAGYGEAAQVLTLLAIFLMGLAHLE